MRVCGCAGVLAGEDECATRRETYGGEVLGLADGFADVFADACITPVRESLESAEIERQGWKRWSVGV